MAGTHVAEQRYCMMMRGKPRLWVQTGQTEWTAISMVQKSITILKPLLSDKNHVRLVNPKKIRETVNTFVTAERQD